LKRSTDRILTTHTGRLDPPSDVRDMQRGPEAEKNMASDAYRAKLQQSITDIVKRQRDVGIDVVSDGELGKVNSFPYYSRRMTGLKSRPVREGEPPGMWERTGERQEFAEFYEYLGFRTARERMFFDGPISYIGEAEVQRDIDMAKAGIEAAGGNVSDAFMCVLAPGWLEHWMYNEYYKSDEEYLFAIAAAMHHEYKAIIDAGFILQLDDPGLPDTYDMIAPTPSIEDYRRFAEIRVDAMNHALKGLPEDRIRYHICWGSWHGPHTHDLPLKHVVDLMLKVTAEAYSVEAANPQHEHQWKVWRETKLPEGKILIPGVVSHASNVVEHPELVADRIVQYAGLVGRENVIASTDCGMGGRVHHQIGWAKLEALVEGARMATKELWG
jgi:5-methyltetrahydropteroyltriglutamate--homocysteine methyltransferase